jgi:hypothetical protein
VLVNVVAGIYAPLIHGFSNTILKNIKAGILPPNIIAPPRDAIPLTNSIKTLSEIHNIKVDVCELPVNRNIAGITNNQKQVQINKSPYLDLLFDQAVNNLSNLTALTEVETGIYGTTSLIMANSFKSRGVEKYYPIKFYGLGPNLSFIHAVLSNGQEWIAENAEDSGLVSRAQIENLMVLLDTMEELGMEKMYQSVEKLIKDNNGVVKPVLVPVSDQEFEVAQMTNQIIVDTAELYSRTSIFDVQNIIEKVPNLIYHSKNGFPFTLSDAIPSMNSKEQHYNSIRTSKLFDYPSLKL